MVGDAWLRMELASLCNLCRGDAAEDCTLAGRSSRPVGGTVKTPGDFADGVGAVNYSALDVDDVPWFA